MIAGHPPYTVSTAELLQGRSLGSDGFASQTVFLCRDACVEVLMQTG
jgi:hypothetical protein